MYSGKIQLSTRIQANHNAHTYVKLFYLCHCTHKYIHRLYYENVYKTINVQWNGFDNQLVVLFTSWPSFLNSPINTSNTHTCYMHNMKQIRHYRIL